MQWQSLREGLPLELAEGLRAFSLGQADLQKCLALHFQELWHGALDTDNNDNNDDDNDNNDDDYDNNDDDDDNNDGSECEEDLDFGEDEGDD